ncbi:MAG: glycoside hydrolase family 127 protein [Acidobacteria bacterium]|nr:glycoside hydrolase family 127 protein [Acidobacteriota bacterium]
MAQADRVETGRKVWAPWYTLHKVYAGLIDMYTLCGNEQALKIALGMARWARQRTDRLDEAQMQKMLGVEHGGINDALRNLYAVTGDPELLALARRFDHKAVLDPLAAHEDRLKGLHVNTQIPKVIGAARAYELTGESCFHDAATYFWNQVTAARCYAAGGTSNDEHWRTEPYRMASELGRESHETCCTYNMLRLTRHLFTWNPEARYADYYERALFNGILATQDPANGMMMYYVPMASGFYKTFMTPEDSFWCCTGTGMENHAKYGDSIYFHDESGLFVNLFIASELDWIERGIRIRQETSFPEEANTKLIVRTGRPAEFALKVRIPSWVAPGGKAVLNGKPLEAFSSPGSHLVLKRTWRDGDTLLIDLPMKLYLERLPDDADTAAILYGPLVLAGDLGSERLTADKVLGPMGPSGEAVAVPRLAGDRRQLDSWIKQVPGKILTFRTVGAGRPDDVTLVPFYKLFGCRYAIYWELRN